FDGVLGLLGEHCSGIIHYSGTGLALGSLLQPSLDLRSLRTSQHFAGHAPQRYPIDVASPETAATPARSGCAPALEAAAWCPADHPRNPKDAPPVLPHVRPIPAGKNAGHHS